MWPKVASAGPSCGMDWLLLMSALFPAGFMVGLVVAMRIWPPNSVNRMYGYRTRRSMASQEAWDYAQPRSIELMRQWTVWMVVWTPLVLWRWRLEDATLILCGLMTVGVLMPLWYVERELKSATVPAFRSPERVRVGVHVVRVWQRDGAHPTQQVRA